MTCNLLNNQQEILEAFRVVSESTTGAEWCLLDYDGHSNIVRVAQRGSEGGLSTLLEQLHSGHVQYGFFGMLAEAASDHQQQQQLKVVMIHWQGEGVPAARLAQTASHAEDIRRLLRPIHTTVLARNEEDVEIEALQRQLAQKLHINAVTPAVSSAASFTSSAPFVPPAPLARQHSSSTKAEPPVSLGEREQFWQQQLHEEEQRRKEDAQRREHDAKLAVEDRRRLEQQLHEKAVKLQQQKSQSFDHQLTTDSSRNGHADNHSSTNKGKLIRGRTELFESKVRELEATIPKPLTKPKNFKYQVAVLEPSKQPAPVNTGMAIPEAPPKRFECAFVLKPKTPLAGDASNGQPSGGQQQQTNVAAFSPSIPVQEVSPVMAVMEAEKEKHEHHQRKVEMEHEPATAPPPVKSSQHPAATNATTTATAGKSTKARALWDYQAEDATEISFDPDEIITDVEQLHEGWWRGRSANGQLGLFPSNFVELI